MEAGGETLEAARWSARAAYWAGSSRPQDALRLWRKAMELTEELEETEETTALAVMSRLLQLDFAWRLGMDDEEEARLDRRSARRSRRGPATCTRWRCCKVATDVAPGHAARGLDAGSRRCAETIDLADESGDLHLRIAIRAAGSYAHLCAGDFDGFDRALDEVLELAGDDRRAGAGIVIGSPVAWATMAKGLVLRERGQLEEAEAQFNAALRIATEEGDPEIASWTRSNQALMLAMRGELDGGDRPGAAQLRADRTARRRLLAQPRPGQPRRVADRRRRLRGGARLARRGRARLPRRGQRRRRDGDLAGRPAGARR